LFAAPPRWVLLKFYFFSLRSQSGAPAAPGRREGFLGTGNWLAQLKLYHLTREGAFFDFEAATFPEGGGKTLFQSCSVIPAEAGIQSFQYILDSCFRRSDG
jgi:hypothetical protein